MKPLRVVASFYPLAFAAERVALPGTEVLCLTPAGAEPHDLELTVSDLAAVLDASLVVYVSGMQPTLDRALARRRGPTLDILELADLQVLTADSQPFDGQGSGVPDPHVWLDPQRFAVVASAMAKALGNEPGAAPLLAELAELDADFARQLSRCARRSLVANHAAFGYLADRYGLRQIALSGLAPEAEPTPGALARLVEAARAEKARAVFAEPLLSQDTAEWVARQVGGQVLPLDPLEVPSGPGYFEIMRVNLQNLLQGLECSPSSSSSGRDSGSTPANLPSPVSTSR